jgi:hypothetical protein
MAHPMTTLIAERTPFYRPDDSLVDFVENQSRARFSPATLLREAGGRWTR